MKFTITIVAILLAVGSAFAGESVMDLKGEALQQRLSADLKAVGVYRNGLASTMRFVASRKDLFPSTKLAEARPLSREDKEAVWATWKTFLDYSLALDSIGKFTADFFLARGDARQQAFLAHDASFLAVYRSALEFIDVAEKDPGLRVLLNDPVPELGLPKGVYDQLKVRFLNVQRAQEFSAMQVYFKTVNCKGNQSTCDAIQADTAAIWNIGKGKGEVLTAKAALQLLEKAGFNAYFPVQAGVAEWMGDEKVLRKNVSLISHEQVDSMRTRLEPGDILFVRREWYLSNIGLPGFWPHGALYIGTPEERRKYFDDPEVKTWLTGQGWTSGDYEALLKAKNPQAYEVSLKPQMGHPVRVLEAMSEGVSFTALEHCIDADSAAVIRPKLAKKEKAIALMRAFHYAGRPYDFNFDFLTDSEIVCTELVYKAYEPATGYHGLTFRLLDILGRKAIPANEMVHQFDEQYGTPQQQSDFVLFLDGNEGIRKAAESTLEAFRQSWKRPKWFIVTQMKP
jgi:hypothetical protein